MCDVLRDNTGERRYVEDMILPTTSFPSDHAVISATFHMRPQVTVQDLACANSSATSMSTRAADSPRSTRHLTHMCLVLNDCTPFYSVK